MKHYIKAFLKWLSKIFKKPEKEKAILETLKQRLIPEYFEHESDTRIFYHKKISPFIETRAHKRALKHKSINF